MKTAEKLNAMVDYIEKHLTEDICMDKLARISCRSVSDANRMFILIADISIADYIRKRRMTVAGYEIQHNGLKVIDAAVKYCYDSPVSFSRAFYAFHGITPNKVHNSDIVLKSFRRLEFKISVKQVSKRSGTEKVILNGKEYKATYLGEADMSINWGYYSKREYLRLENAYDDFCDMPRIDSFLPYSNYTAEVKEGQVFIIDYYLASDGSVDRRYMIADGTVWLNMPVTVEIRIVPETVKREEPIIINGKEYKAVFLGEDDISQWSKIYGKREFRRIEDAYADFCDKPRLDHLFSYSNYPTRVKNEQVFAIDFFLKSGEFSKRVYHISDGTVLRDKYSTQEIVID